MAMTPEGKVKDRVKKILTKYARAYRITPTTGGYGASGAPDVVACIEGKFVGVECKANGNKPTALQMKNLNEIVAAGGYAFVVDDKSIGVFILSLDNAVGGRLPPSLMDLTREEGEN